MWCQQRTSFALRCRQSNRAGTINSDERRQRAEGLLVDNFVPKPKGKFRPQCCRTAMRLMSAAQRSLTG